MNLSVNKHRDPTAILSFIFFLSGAAALTYEILWLRWLSLSLGSTAISLTIILVAFMTGLALGAWKIGTWTDGFDIKKIARVIVGLEFLIGIYALLMPYLLNLLESTYSAFYVTAIL